MLLAADKIDRRVFEEIRSWEFSGFSFGNNVYLLPGDTSALERLAQYILGCPFSLARVVRLTDDGSVIYRAEQDPCPRFPTPANADLRGGPCRNFQVFSALDLLTELTQHVPEQGEHLVRYYGWYSHRQRGIRAKLRRIPEPELELVPIDRSALHAERSASGRPPAGSLSTWAMLIKLVYEVDPLACPQCGGTLKIINFIKPRQWDVIEWILRHCGLWEGAIRSARWPMPVATERLRARPGRAA